MVVQVLARPSQKRAEVMAKEEKERVLRQRETLGDSTLQERERLLSEAMERNEILCPDDVIGSVPIPGTSDIFFHPIVSVGNHQEGAELAGVRECEVFPVQSLPFFFHLNHIHSSFVEVSYFTHTHTLEQTHTHTHNKCIDTQLTRT